jgi:Cof subfamily protein (haloacid dehalogenase superfamily)
VLRPRTVASIAAARVAGIRVLIATGRMFRSARPYATAAGIREPLICYQGALIVDPLSGDVLLHRPIELSLALEAIAAVEAEGFPLNCYVEDELYVARATPESERYSGFQNIHVHEVGPLHAWLDRPPTKLVTIGDPELLDALELRLEAHFGERLFISKSLPYFLELASPEVSKGSGLAFVADRLGFPLERTIGVGDGENDVELLEWAGYAVAVENAHDKLKAIADLVCPAAAEEGVAQLLEAVVRARGVSTLRA